MSAGRIAALVLALGVMAMLAVLAPAQSEQRDGPAGSSYVTEPHGTAAYRDLLEATGRDTTRVRRPLDGVRLRADDTVVVLDPRSLSRADAAAIGSFVARGGRAVLGGRGNALRLDEILANPPSWTAVATGGARPLAPVPETAGIGLVQALGRGVWTDAGETVPILGRPDLAIAAVASVGEGRVVLLADATVLQNRNLDRADNAGFGLAVVGPEGTRVVFLESVHGFAPSGGLANLPVRWRWAIAGLVAAAAVWMLSRARRLGPPTPQDRRLPPPRVLYVDSLAASLARTRRPTEAVAPVRREARRLVTTRSGLGPHAGDAEVRQAAAGLGLAADEVDAIVNDPAGEAGIVAAGRALARLTGRPSSPPDGESR